MYVEQVRDRGDSPVSTAWMRYSGNATNMNANSKFRDPGQERGQRRARMPTATFAASCPPRGSWRGRRRQPEHQDRVSPTWYCRGIARSEPGQLTGDNLPSGA